ncbi:MAG: aminotransferase class I/II-fold pyridoxal phosphate-dependent enzyme [Thermoleophilia bacterium]|nr:aminotransferase class I/II-fold pyridoxal phosphate-dependent enzyme [Thermoleophilia bacterium]
MNPLAAELNQVIEQHAPAVLGMLSTLGRELYFPKGILTQTAEAKQKAYRFNATIGEAREAGHAMSLSAITEHFVDLDADEVLPYAPSAGRAELRARWREEIRKKNPSLAEVPISLPVVTSGITHGLSTVADMFVEAGDVVLLPDQVWGNYNLVFGVKRGARLVRYPLLSERGGLDVAGFARVLEENSAAGKVVVLFNFPNNPTGYAPTAAEAQALQETLVSVAERGCKLVAVCDDAYFGLFYDPEVMRESLFGLLAAAHPRLLAVKLDGASKEDFAWGLRVAFITYGIAGGAGMYEALEKKTAGCIRGTISNSCNLSQYLVLKALEHPEYEEQKAAGFAALTRRAAKARAALADEKYAAVWTPYPFNSGYFLCLRLHDLDAEAYRVRLLERYGVGVISTSDTDIRVAISSVDEEDIAELFSVMYTCAVEMAAEAQA